MTPRAVNQRPGLVESVALQLHAWKPFQLQSLSLDPSRPCCLPAKKPCRADRSTAPAAADSLDLSRLTLLEDPPPPPRHREERFRWFARKRRRCGSRSISGRSSDRSGTRLRGGASATYGTCSDFPIAAGGTDSSGEMFMNGDASWCSDVSEKRVSRREGREAGNGGGSERECSGIGAVQGGLEAQGNESGYGSEPGYRGDGELGYDDEFDEEDDDGRQLFWGKQIGDTSEADMVGEDKFGEQKSHHRCRRKKHDWRIMASLR